MSVFAELINEFVDEYYHYFGYTTANKDELKAILAAMTVYSVNNLSEEHRRVLEVILTVIKG